MAPRALYYDGGLAILGLVAAGDALGRRSLPYVSGAWLLAAAQPLRDYLPVPPVTVVVVGAFVLALKASARAAVRKPGGPVDGDRDE